MPKASESQTAMDLGAFRSSTARCLIDMCGAQGDWRCRIRHHSKPFHLHTSYTVPFIPSFISLLLFFSSHPSTTLISRDSFLTSTRYESHSDICCCRGRRLCTSCSRSPAPVPHPVLHSGLLLCLETPYVPIPPPPAPDPRTMDPSGRSDTACLPRAQRVLCRGLRLVVARPQSSHIRRGRQSSRYTHDVKRDPSLCGTASCFPCRPARAPSQDHPQHPPYSRMDGLWSAVATCHGGSFASIASAQRSPEPLRGYCTMLLLPFHILLLILDRPQRCFASSSSSYCPLSADSHTSSSSAHTRALPWQPFMRSGDTSPSTKPPSATISTSA